MHPDGDARSDHWQGIPDLYDVAGPDTFVPNPDEVPTEYRLLLKKVLDERGHSPARQASSWLLPTALPLAEAHRLLRALSPRRLRGNIIPVRYRVPRITQEEAYQMAQEHLEVLRRTNGRTYGKLIPREGGYLWWTFFAPDRQAQDEGLIPGGPFIDIDRWDGHLVDDREYHAYLRFNVGVHPDDHWLGLPDRYDVILLSGAPPRREVALAAPDRRLIEEALEQHRKSSLHDTQKRVSNLMLPLERSLPEARAFVRALKDARAVAGLVPARYRLAPLSPEAAQHAAHHYVMAQRRKGTTLGAPTEGRKGPMWWNFAARRDGAMAGVAEGSPHVTTHVFIHIDGWDGHVVSEQEEEAYEWFNDVRD